MYPQGYFRQRITPEGWQEAAYAPFNQAESPIHHALTPSGDACRITGRDREQGRGCSGLESARRAGDPLSHRHRCPRE